MIDSATLKKEVSARLKLARKALKMTQDLLCQRTGMPLPSLKDYEGGKRVPGGEALSMLMRAGISPSWLLTGHGEMFRAPAALLGNAISKAIWDSGMPIEEVASAAGIDENTLRAYMDGLRKPTDALLERVSEITGTPVGDLIAAKETGETLANIYLTAATEATVQHANESQVEYLSTLNAAEDELLDRYRRADEKGKTLLLKISAAVAAPSLKAWFDAGLALSEAATIFETKR